MIDMDTYRVKESLKMKSIMAERDKFFIYKYVMGCGIDIVLAHTLSGSEDRTLIITPKITIPDLERHVWGQHIYITTPQFIYKNKKVLKNFKQIIIKHMGIRMVDKMYSMVKEENPGHKTVIFLTSSQIFNPITNLYESEYVSKDF